MAHAGRAAPSNLFGLPFSRIFPFIRRGLSAARLLQRRGPGGSRMRTAIFALTAMAALSGAAQAQVQDRYSPGRPAGRGIIFVSAPAPAPIALAPVSKASRALVWPEAVATAASPRTQRTLNWPGKISGSSEQAAVPARAAPQRNPPPERAAAYPPPMSLRPPSSVIQAAPSPAPAPLAAPVAQREFLQPADRDAAQRLASASLRPAPLPSNIYDAPPPRRLAPASVPTAPSAPSASNTTFSLPVAAAPAQLTVQPRPAPVANAPRADAISRAPTASPVAEAAPRQPAALTPAPLTPRYATGGQPVGAYTVAGMAPRRYSVHRAFGEAPDPIQMPKEFFNQGVVDLAEPPPPLPPKVNEKGKTQAQVKAAEARAAERRASDPQ